MQLEQVCNGATVCSFLTPMASFVKFGTKDRPASMPRPVGLWTAWWATITREENSSNIVVWNTYRLRPVPNLGVDSIESFQLPLSGGAGFLYLITACWSDWAWWPLRGKSRHHLLLFSPRPRKVHFSDSMSSQWPLFLGGGGGGVIKSIVTSSALSHYHSSHVVN